MGMLVSLGLGVLKFFMGSNAGKLIDGVTSVIKNKTDASVIDAQTGANLGVEYLKSVNETNRIKAERQTETQVLFALLIFALPCGVVWWLALMDGIPFFGHVRGSWRIAVPPDFASTYQMIVQSFFIAAPTLAGVSMLARIFRK